jgi:hypothetical protein
MKMERRNINVPSLPLLFYIFFIVPIFIDLV